MHPGGDANVGRVRAIHDEMRQCEDTEHNHPGQHERQERLAGSTNRPASDCRAEGASVVGPGGVCSPGSGRPTGPMRSGSGCGCISRAAGRTR